MPAYLWVIVACWAVFVLYWLSSAAFAKRSVSTSRTRTGLLIRFALAVIIVGFAWYEAHTGNQAVRHAPAFAGPVPGWIGAAIVVCGTAIALWARTYLGRNWGMPMTLRETPELVTAGPYAYVRNPIYTGVLLAFIGVMFATNIWWGVVLIIGAAYFIISIFREEKDMAAQFPDTYPAYKARTKRLIPFIW